MKWLSKIAKNLSQLQQLSLLSPPRSLLVTCCMDDVKSHSWAARKTNFAAAVITAEQFATDKIFYSNHCQYNSKTKKEEDDDDRSTSERHQTVFLFPVRVQVATNFAQQVSYSGDSRRWSFSHRLSSSSIQSVCRTNHHTIQALSSSPDKRNISPSYKTCTRTILTTTVTTAKEGEQDITMNQQVHQAKNIWRKAEAICFDVDSTVIQDEAIDELAKFCGKGDEVEQLTREAMKGGMDFRQALALRLDLIRPSLQQLRSYILSTKHRLSPYVKELIHELHKRGKEVYLVSGGFRSIIIPLANELHIPTSNIYANKLKFYHDGEYAGFDENQLTSRTGGKGAVIRNLKEKHGYETVVMVGDGITDWEASPPADLFIGFGGNAYRQEVKSKSKWYVTDFRDLINELRD